MSKRVMSLALTGALLVIVALMAWTAFDFNEQARRVPLAVGLPTVGLLGLQFVRELLGLRLGPEVSDAQEDADGEASEPPEGSVAGPGAETQRTSSSLRAAEMDTTSYKASALQSFIWVLVLGVSFYLLGMLITVPLFIVSFMRIYGRETWKAISMVLIPTLALLYGLFVIFLEVQLYPGVAREWLGL